MRTVYLPLTLLFGAMFCMGSALAAEEKKEDGPVATLQAYYSALQKGEIKKADELTARSSTLPEAHITQYNTVFSNRADTSFLWTIHPKRFKQVGDCAAVICELGPEGSSETMRAFLLKQDGKWKVYLKFWEEENAWYVLEGQQAKDAAAVEKWCADELKK